MQLRFGTSGIRGIVNLSMNNKDLVTFSKSLSLLYKSPFVISRDTRKGSNLLLKTIKACLSWLGFEIIDLGLLPTPILAFSTRNLKANMGIQITASHNPSEYTGIKLFDSDGMALTRDEEKKIEEKMKEVDEEKFDEKFKNGRVYSYEVATNDYINALIKILPETKRRLKIVVDCSNGVGSTATPTILKMLGHEVITINSHTSWIFPGRKPEPTLENLQETSSIVSRIKPDLAIAHDGDADRVVLLDKNGRILPDHFLSSIYLSILLEKRVGDVVLSINTSRAVEDIAREANCNVHRARLGKTFVELKRISGIFATEPSKIIDSSWGFWEDGILASTMIVQYISFNETSLKDLTRNIPTYYYVQKNIRANKRDYNLLRDEIKNYSFEKKIEGIDELDGIKINFDDKSWLLLRFSGTEQKARVYAEAKKEKDAKRLAEIGLRLIKKSSILL